MNRSSSSRPFRRRLAIALAAAVCTAPLAACGSADGGSGAGGKDGGDGGAFPAKIATKFGTVTVPEKPKRVVALGWGDAETALALGVQPVGASDWLGFGGDGVGPWAKGRYTHHPKIIGTMEPKYEDIAKLKPDLILDTKSAGDAKRYNTLKKIAPTVDVPKGGEQYRISWQRQVSMVAAALGRKAQGAKLTADTEAAFRKAAAQHPEFKGKTVALGALSGAGWGAYVRGGGRVEFMEALGFRNSPAIQKRAGNGFSITVSHERLDLLDADLTVMTPIGTSASAITKDKVYRRIPSVKAGRSVVFADKNLSNAFSTNSVLSLPYALKKVVPVLAAPLEKEKKK